MTIKELNMDANTKAVYFQREARKRLLYIRKKYKTNGIDILSAPIEYIKKREDYFYKIDILQNGKVWYERVCNRLDIDVNMVKK